jgi:hypothetical protein
MNVFSFCLYGSNPKYCEGMTRNLELIRQRFPDFYVFLYCSQSVPLHYVAVYQTYPQVRIEWVPHDDASLMVWRFFPIDLPEVNCMFVRDADSRVNDRDEWCVRAFLQSEDKSLHIIRDHYWHQTKITGGMWGMKRSVSQPSIKGLYEEWIQTKKMGQAKYDDDQKFLQDKVYPCFQPSQRLIHSNIVGHVGETVSPIPDELFSNEGFIGNVWDFYDGVEEPTMKFNDFPLVKHVLWLQRQDQFALVAKVTKGFDVHSVKPAADRNLVLDAMFIAAFYMEDYERCLEVLRMFAFTHVSTHNIQNANFLLKKLGKKIVGTTDPERKPASDEIVVCYGKYPMDVRALPCCNPMYRNSLEYTLLAHTVFESNPCWDNVARIYILNLEDRVDRLTEITAELCAVGAPLDRVYHYKATKTKVTGDGTVDAYLGATKNHLDVVRHFMQTPDERDHCLVLEDDFMFLSNTKAVQTSLQTFFERDYDYHVCLLAASKFYETKPHDDLLRLSYQECTTTAGYLLKRQTCGAVLECFQEGYDGMLRTRNYTTYVCDRYWAKLQPQHKFFMFDEKLGYQRCSYSSITKTVAGLHFD